MTTLERRVDFLTEFARRLHLAGVSANRLEGAVRATAAAIGVTCEIWYTPTGILLSLGDATDANVPQLTRVLRVEPASVDLAALASLDATVEEVIAGRMTVEEASQAFRALDRPPSRRRRVSSVIAFGLSAAAVAGLFRGTSTDLAVAGALGIVIALITIRSAARTHFDAAAEAIAAIVATLLASAFAHFVAPISVETVVIAALIVLMPGLTLTTAVTELASRQLVAGTTRFAGALVALLKLTFGSIAGAQLATLFGWTIIEVPAVTTMPPWFEWIAAIAAAFAFSILFHTRPRDLALVIGSALLGFALTRLGATFLAGTNTSFAGGVFFSSLVIAALSNLYGRFANRPGAIIRLPGIMLMVPGSVGFRGLSFVLERDYSIGLDTGIAVLHALIALTAGLLFGSVLVEPRRHL